MASRQSSKSGVAAKPGSTVREPRAVIDPVTVGLTAKSIYEAAKAGVDLSVKLYEATKGEVALVCGVHESQAIDNRFRLRLRLSSVCPHGIAINTIKLGSLKDVPVNVYLLRPAAWRWSDSPSNSPLNPAIPGKTGVQVSSAFVIPPMGTQELALEIERDPVVKRIFNKRGATLLMNYNVLGRDGDPADLKVQILFRDDQPILAGFPIAGS